MALLILAGLQMLPGDIYEAAKIDGVHPIKVFWKITLPLIRPALMVAIIFRGARRAPHLRPDLRADPEQRADHVDVDLRAPEPVRLRQVLLRLGRLDLPVPGDRSSSPSSTSGRPPQFRGRRGDAAEADQVDAVLPARRDHRGSRGLPVLLRDPDLVQIRHRDLRGQLLAEELLLRPTTSGLHRGQLRRATF